MKATKFQTIDTVIYTDCTMEEVIKEAFDIIKPTELDKVEVLTAFQNKATNRCVMRREGNIIYSASIWSEEKSRNGIQVSYYTDYL